MAINNRLKYAMRARILSRTGKCGLKLCMLCAVMMMVGTPGIAGCQREEPWRLTVVDNKMPSLDFTLTRAKDGNVVTSKDYRGQVVVLEFGYTHCPDVCPTTLSNLTSALSQLGDKAKDVRVLFVTVDP